MINRTVNLENTKGMTLTEVMIVVAIIAIVASVGVPMFKNSRYHLNLREKTQTLIRDLRTAQSFAEKENLTYKVVFDTAADSYRVCKDDPTVANNPGDECDPPPVVATRLLGTEGMGGLVSLTSVTDGGGNETSISFGGSGYISAPAAPPVTMTLLSCDAAETMQVQIQRIGGIQTLDAKTPC
ncbi:MAG TPA: GspH/FimT family protein [Nitrospiria bacterium]|jgi:prepilin-type N-terminal cleavage/methylation domain-containing protein|nr:GspH/FimT family protein [Nitrospiria bacterium]